MGIFLLGITALAIFVVIIGIIKDAPTIENAEETLESQGHIEKCVNYDADDLYGEEKYQRFCDGYKQSVNSGANWHRDKARAKKGR
jgi:hypothetical protein